MEYHSPFKNSFNQKLVVLLFLVFVISFLTFTIIAISWNVTSNKIGSYNASAQIIANNPVVIEQDTIESFSFTTVGDFGNDRSTNSSMNNVLRGIGSANVDFHLGLGDYIYSNTLSEISPWCQNVKDRINEGAGRSIGDPYGNTFPFELAIGNHDSGEHNSDIITIANSLRDCLPHRINNITHGQQINGSAYALEYYFDYPATTNPLARVIMIAPDITGPNITNWSYARNDTHYNFVRNAILTARAANPPIPWIIVGMHKNCITNGVKTCEIDDEGGEVLNLLFGRDLDSSVNYPNVVGYGRPVDLVLQGHEHSYHRSKQIQTRPALSPSPCPTIPINGYSANCVGNHGPTNFSKNQGGILAIVGTGGLSLRSIPGSGDNEASYFNSWMGTNETFPINGQGATWGLLKVTINQTQLSAQFIRSSGGTFSDAFTIIGPTPTSTPPLTPSLTPSPTYTPLRTDINRDGTVGAIDFSRLRAKLGTSCPLTPPPYPTPACAEDIVCDGLINIQDFSKLREAFGVQAFPTPNLMPYCDGSIPYISPTP